MLSGRGLCDELIARPEDSYRLCCVVVCDLETSRMGAPYIYDISRLRVNVLEKLQSDNELYATCPLTYLLHKTTGCHLKYIVSTCSIVLSISPVYRYVHMS